MDQVSMLSGRVGTAPPPVSGPFTRRRLPKGAWQGQRLRNLVRRLRSDCNYFEDEAVPFAAVL